MMAKTIKITLGDDEYEVPRLNIGQIEDLMDVQAEAAAGSSASTGDIRPIYQRAKKISIIVLRRATPKIEDFDALECSHIDLRVATDAVLAFSGMKGKAPEGEAEPATAGQQS